MKICVQPTARQSRESSERYRRGRQHDGARVTTPLWCREVVRENCVNQSGSASVMPALHVPHFRTPVSRVGEPTMRGGTCAGTRLRLRTVARANVPSSTRDGGDWQQRPQEKAFGRRPC